MTIYWLLYVVFCMVVSVFVCRYVVKYDMNELPSVVKTDNELVVCWLVFIVFAPVVVLVFFAEMLTKLLIKLIKY